MNYEVVKALRRQCKIRFAEKKIIQEKLTCILSNDGGRWFLPRAVARTSHDMRRVTSAMSDKLDGFVFTEDVALFHQSPELCRDYAVCLCNIMESEYSDMCVIDDVIDIMEVVFVNGYTDDIKQSIAYDIVKISRLCDSMKIMTDANPGLRDEFGSVAVAHPRIPDLESCISYGLDILKTPPSDYYTSHEAALRYYVARSSSIVADLESTYADFVDVIERNNGVISVYDKSHDAVPVDRIDAIQKDGKFIVRHRLDDYEYIARKGLDYELPNGPIQLRKIDEEYSVQEMRDDMDERAILKVKTEDDHWLRRRAPDIRDEAVINDPDYYELDKQREVEMD